MNANADHYKTSLYIAGCPDKLGSISGSSVTALVLAQACQKTLINYIILDFAVGCGFKDRKSTAARANLQHGFGSLLY